MVYMKVKQYANDTAIYCASDSSTELSSSLSEDLARVGRLGGKKWMRLE